MKIGERIRQRRKKIGLSVDELAEILGKNRATVYRYESNEIEKLPTTVLEPLAKALKTTPAYLMGWEDEDLIAEALATIEAVFSYTDEDDVFKRSRPYAVSYLALCAAQEQLSKIGK